MSLNDIESRLAPLEASLAAYEGRMARIESALDRISDVERRLDKLEVLLDSRLIVKRKDLERLERKVGGKIEAIAENLRGTPAYGLKNSFSCSTCGEKGYVGIQVTCTSCEKERKLGWFPGEDSRERRKVVTRQARVRKSAGKTTQRRRMR